MYKPERHTGNSELEGAISPGSWDLTHNTARVQKLSLSNLHKHETVNSFCNKNH